MCTNVSSADVCVCLRRVEAAAAGLCIDSVCGFGCTAELLLNWGFGGKGCCVCIPAMVINRAK